MRQLLHGCVKRGVGLMSDWSRSCVTSRKVALACRPLVREQMLCSQKEQVGTKDYISSPSVTNNNYENALYNLWLCSEVYFCFSQFLGCTNSFPPLSVGACALTALRFIISSHLFKHFLWGGRRQLDGAAVSGVSPEALHVLCTLCCYCVSLM